MEVAVNSLVSVRVPISVVTELKVTELVVDVTVLVVVVATEVDVSFDVVVEIVKLLNDVIDVADKDVDDDDVDNDSTSNCIASLADAPQ